MTPSEELLEHACQSIKKLLGTTRDIVDDVERDDVGSAVGIQIVRSKLDSLEALVLEVELEGVTEGRWRAVATIIEEIRPDLMWDTLMGKSIYQ